MEDLSEIKAWTSTLLEHVKLKEPSLDFMGEGVETRTAKRKNGVFRVDLYRSRDDGFFDRMLFHYQFYKPTDYLEMERTGLSEFGWFVNIQYAINIDKECPIPCLVNGGYCTLFDLTEYEERDDDFISLEDDYVLGEDREQMAMRIEELGDFLALSIPRFVSRMMKERMGR